MKFTLIFSSFCAVVLLAACGGTPAVDSPDPAVDDTEQLGYEERSGVVAIVNSANAGVATHQLEASGMPVIFLESANPRLSLDDYVGQDVVVEGIIRELLDGSAVLSVVALTAHEETTATPAYRDFIDSDYRYGISYPSVFLPEQTRSGVRFLDADRTVVELSITQNTSDKDLFSFLVDRYGYGDAQLAPVRVNSLSGYRYEDVSGQVIYLPRGGEIIALAWLDTSAETRARDKRFFLEMVQSLNPAIFADDQQSDDTRAGAGEPCGGAEEIRCASGLSCQLTTAQVAATGICVAAAREDDADAFAAQITENEELPALSRDELTRGWYYGDRDMKKPATPDTWILVDSGTRFAMWRRPHTEIEYSPALPAATSDTSALSDTQQAVFTRITRDLATLAPEPPSEGSWQLVQLAFAQPSYVYATYQSMGETRRLLFLYVVVGSDVTLEKKAYQKPGADRDWITLEGSDSAFGKALTVVDASGSVSDEILAGYRAYQNQRHSYTLHYPKDWYWQHVGSERVEFSDTPFPAGIVRIAAALIEGVDFPFGEAQNENGMTVIYLAFDADRSLRLSGSAELQSTLEVMARSYQR